MGSIPKNKNLKLIRKILANRTSFYFPKYSPVILFAIILLFAYAYHYHEVINLRPQGVHQWRQCDCLSITSKLYLDESTFFRPEVFNLLHDGEGRTASDFPLFYYTVSMLWKVFGKHEWIFRLLNFLVSILGMMALLKIFEGFLKDSFWSIFSVCILFTSGIYVYYSLNFLMNTTALNMVFIGWYFFFRFYHNKRHIYLYLTFLLFLTGGLLKMSSLISFVALCGLFFFEWVGFLKNQATVFRNKWAFMIPAFLLVGISVLWVSYVSAYNQKWNSGVFLVGILPIWELSGEQISGIVDNIRHIWLDEYFYRPIHFLFMAGLLGLWIFIKKNQPVLLILTTLIAIGFVGIVILFFSPLGQHDYYVIDLLILSVFIMLSSFTLIIGNKSRYRIIDLTVIKLFALGFLALAVIHTSKHQEERYKGWHNQRHQTEFYGYASIEPYLDSLGIVQNTKVISKNDPSINITLYLMNRQGWTKYGTNMNDSTTIAERIKTGAEYLVYHEEIDLSTEPHWAYFMKGVAGQYKNVTIQKIGLPD